MRVIFLGTPEFAVPSLRALIDGACEVCAVCTQPDRPAGRGQKSHASAIKDFALQAGIRVFQPEKIRDSAHRPLLASFQPDFIVTVAYGQILPAWLLQLPRLGCVNVHGSLLPRHRGAAPVTWAILKGDGVTGVTTMLMDEHLDTGPMLLQREVAIAPEMTSGELAALLSAAGAELMIPTLAGLADGSLKPMPQDDSLATFAPRITKDMARIGWEHDALSIHNQVRGLNPWPLGFSECVEQRIQIFKSGLLETPAASARKPGTFLGTTKHGMRVACGERNEIEILEVQPAGKKRMWGRDFANGARLQAGISRFR